MRARPFAILLLLLLCPVDARASNEDDYFPGSRASMTAGAVAASVADGSATYFNPAGLAAVRGSRLDVSASAYTLRHYSVRSFVRLGNERVDASVNEVVTVPVEIAYVRRLSDFVSLGLGYFVPVANDAILRARAESVAVGRTETTALETRATASKFMLGAALGIRAASWLRVGGGLFGVYERDASSTSFSGSVAKNGVTERFEQVAILSATSRLGAQPSAGVQLDLGAGVTLGAAFRGPRLQVAALRDDGIQASAATRGAEGELRHVSSASDDGGKQVVVREWGRYSAGLGYRFGASAVSLEMDVAPGMSPASDSGNPGRRLAINARVGAVHAFSDRILFGAGFFTDRTTERGTTYANFLGCSAGVELSEFFRLAEGEKSQGFRLGSTIAVRYARGSGPTSTLVAGADVGPGDGRSLSTQVVDELTLQVGSTLHF